MKHGELINTAIGNMQLDQRKVSWMVTGIALGYPTCCIKAFVNLEHMLDPVPRKLVGTGYVPCPHCNETKTTMELVDTINRAREPGIPPFSHNPEEHQRLG